MSRVVHPRLDDVTIAQCYMTMERNGLNIIRVPVATAVAQCLRAFIRGAEVSGHLDHMTVEEAREVLASLNSGPDGEVDDFAGVRPDFMDMPEAPETDAIAGAVDAALQAVLGGGMVASAPVGLEAPESEFLPLMAYDKIKSAAPLDALVQQAEELEDGAITTDRFKKALCIVYSNIDMDMWGTAKARELVQGTYATLGDV